MSKSLRVVILKPSKYNVDGYVERFRLGCMPNATVPFMKSLTPPRIKLYGAYSRYYTLSHSIRYLRRNARLRSVKFNLHPVFNRYAAWRRFHPLAGGVGRVFRDNINDYLPLRRKMFRFDRIPLPDNLQLSKADGALNRQAKLPAMHGDAFR